MQGGDEDAYFELSFSPNTRLVATVRRFVGEFYQSVLANAEITSQLMVAAHELLENAVRYSIDGNTTIRVSVKRGPRTRVNISTTNRAVGDHLSRGRKALDDLAAAPDAQAHYELLMRRTMKTTEGSGLGLGRVRAESGMSITYEVIGDTMNIRASAEYDLRSPS